ncbi:hypothetical protein FF38_03575, partial [Lucilia cuprina]
YQPGTSSVDINSAQRELQKSQKSADGWNLASALLSTADPNAQFIGVQTFMVQLNEAHFLPSTDKIYQDLLSCLENCISSNYAVFVVRKLLSVIARVYLRSNDWEQCPFIISNLLSSNLNLYLEFLTFLVEDSELPPASLRTKLTPQVSDLVKQVVMSTNFNTVAAINTFTVWLVEDPLASSVLDFWNTYTEEVVSSGMDKSSIAVIGPVIQSYWPRIRIYNELNISDWNEFASFRRDFADFLELSYQVIGKELFQHLTDVVLMNINLENCNWYEIESAMFCLNGLADIIGEDYKGDRPEFENIRLIFQSPLWTRLPECNSMRVRQTAVNLIGSFVEFFKSLEGQPFLAVTLNYLFTSLSIPTLQNSASNSIKSLCDSSRELLNSELSTFLTVYAQVRSDIQSVPHVRTVIAITYVIQAVSNLEEQTKIANQLLNLISENYTSNTEPEP